MNDKPTFLDFTNKPRGIVPPMEDRVHGTYAETRAEIEARKRAEEEAQQQLIYQQQQIAALQAQQQMVQPKKNTGLVVLAVFMTILALAGLGAAGFLFMNSSESTEKISKLESELETASAIIKKVETETGKDIKTVADVPTLSAMNGILYFEEFGLQIKLKPNLDEISYIYNDNFGYRSSICFNAVTTGTKTSPAFANIKLNPGGMGCLVRVGTEEGDSDAKTGKSFGEKVLSVDGYNYFYQAPEKVYATEDAEKGLETSAVQAIKLMLTDKAGVLAY